ncbi:hypothetical protein DPMN_081135 [Dreissena polymorpha]|uniref:Uncharacterized protein n=1 Tax=Dreissena polymorpha TaxID=45954 RepID=A0A9D3Y5H3_DREPO|nr:hypothetical protein DPMN_081135 [Dreissena polymorpha]
MLANNHHLNDIDRDGSLVKDRKSDRYSLGRRSSVSSYLSRSNRSHRVWKKPSPQEQCVYRLKMAMQCYNVFILVVYTIVSAFFDQNILSVY